MIHINRSLKFSPTVMAHWIAVSILFFFSSFFFGCGVDKNISVNIETTELLPKEIAIDFLNELSGCSAKDNFFGNPKPIKFKNDQTECFFQTNGMMGGTGEFTPYSGIKFRVKDDFGWLVFVRSKTKIQDGCFLVFDVGFEKKTTHEEIKKIVTALTSLGVEPWN